MIRVINTSKKINTISHIKNISSKMNIVNRSCLKHIRDIAGGSRYLIQTTMMNMMYPDLLQKNTKNGFFCLVYHPTQAAPKKMGLSSLFGIWVVVKIMVPVWVP